MKLSEQAKKVSDALDQVSRDDMHALVQDAAQGHRCPLCRKEGILSGKTNGMMLLGKAAQGKLPRLVFYHQECFMTLAMLAFAAFGGDGRAAVMEQLNLLWPNEVNDDGPTAQAPAA